MAATDGRIIYYLWSQVFARALASFLAKPLKYARTQMLSECPLSHTPFQSNLVLDSFHFPCDCLILCRRVQPDNFLIKQQTPTCSFFKTRVFLRQRRKTRNKSSHAESARSCVSNYSCRSCHLKKCKFAYLHQDTTDGGAGQLWHRDVTLDNAPWGFIFGKGSGMVSSLAKRVKYQLLQGETILDHCMLR